MRAAFSLFPALLVAVAAHAFEVGGVLRSVDASSHTLRVTAGGQLRTVRVSTEARILDRDGKPLPAGLKAPELKEGAEVTLTVEPEDGQPVIKAIQLSLFHSGVGRPTPGSARSAHSLGSSPRRMPLLA
jgi:hypothetical protein